MKIHSSKSQNVKGLLLIECVVYLAVLAVIFTLGYGAYFRALDSSRGMQRNAEDVARALNAGERWREDVRLAKSVLITNNVLRITLPKGRIEYAFEQEAVWRTAENQRRIRVLADVKESTMVLDQRQEVAAWRWELELKTRKATSKLKPLFSFQAAPNQKR